LQTRRLVESFEGLSNSLAQLTGELWSCKEAQKQDLQKNLPGAEGVNNFNTPTVPLGSIYQPRLCRVCWLSARV